jgi:nicotinamide riboside kinase
MVAQMEIRRCILIGAESTGKTELAQALARALPATWSGEYVRTFIEQRQRPVVVDDLPAILAGQLAYERAALAAAIERGLTWVVHDTNAWMTTLYARELYGTPLELDADNYCGRDFTYLLCQPDIPWTPDPGQRDGPATRERFHRLFETELQSAGIPFYPVSGEGEERIRNALRVLRSSKQDEAEIAKLRNHENSD